MRKLDWPEVAPYKFNKNVHKFPQHPAKCSTTHHAPTRTFHAASNKLYGRCITVQIKTHFRFSMNWNKTKHNLTKINGKGHAWHNSVLSHCKTFGTRDGGTRGALATSVAPYITRNAHVSHAASCHTGPWAPSGHAGCSAAARQPLERPSRDSSRVSQARADRFRISDSLIRLMPLKTSKLTL